MARIQVSTWIPWHSDFMCPTLPLLPAPAKYPQWWVSGMTTCNLCKVQVVWLQASNTLLRLQAMGRSRGPTWPSITMRFQPLEVRVASLPSMAPSICSHPLKIQMGFLSLTPWAVKRHSTMSHHKIHRTQADRGGHKFSSESQTWTGEIQCGSYRVDPHRTILNGHQSP